MKFPTLFVTRMALAAVLLVAPDLLAGCAKSPSGGPLATNATNTLTVTMTTQQPPNPAFFYAWGFDDSGQSGVGPTAIVGSSPTANNHIVSGTFDVLVLYQSGAFTAYRRTDLGGGNERLDQATRAFVTQPGVSGNVMSFTLDMNATTNSGVNLFQFPAGATRQTLNTNFVTTNSLENSATVNLQKAYDAFGPGVPNEWYTFDVTATRDYTNAGTVNEPTGDVNPGDPSFNLSANDLATLDITDFTLQVVRTP